MRENMKTCPACASVNLDAHTVCQVCGAQLGESARAVETPLRLSRWNFNPTIIIAFVVGISLTFAGFYLSYYGATSNPQLTDGRTVSEEMSILLGIFVFLGGVSTVVAALSKSGTLSYLPTSLPRATGTGRLNAAIGDPDLFALNTSGHAGSHYVAEEADREIARERKEREND